LNNSNKPGLSNQEKAGASDNKLLDNTILPQNQNPATNEVQEIELESPNDMAN